MEKDTKLLREIWEVKGMQNGARRTVRKCKKEGETIREKEKHRYWSTSNRHGSDSTVLHNYIIADKET